MGLGNFTVTSRNFFVITIHYVNIIFWSSQRSRSWKLVKKMPGVQRQNESHFKSNTRPSYILYKKNYTIWAYMMKPLLHINNSQQWLHILFGACACSSWMNTSLAWVLRLLVLVNRVLLRSIYWLPVTLHHFYCQFCIWLNSITTYL